MLTILLIKILLDKKEEMDDWAAAFTFTVIMDVGIFGAISAAVGL